MEYGHMICFHLLNGCIDVKGKIEIAVKRLIQLTKSIALVAEMALQASISASSNKGF